jgi:hypothetical protein
MPAKLNDAARPMDRRSGMSATSETASAGGGRLEPAVFIVVTLAAGMAFWLAPHPPMADLPEHAAQIAFLHDALSGKPDRITPIEISILTPYFLSYLITLPLTFVVSIVTAMKLVLTASFFCFVFAFKSLRRELSDDSRFDWLFLIGYFGVSFQYGFYTFLVPAPLVPIFLHYAWRHARAPSGGSAAGLVLVGLCLLWAHGWLFVVAMLSGAAVVWSEVGFDVRGGLRRSGPYWVLVLAMILLMTFGPPMFNGASSRFGNSIGVRVFDLFMYMSGATHSDPWNPGMANAAAIVAAAILAIGMPFRRSAGRALMGLIIGLYLFTPDQLGSDAWYMGSRLALFVAPYLALGFAIPRSEATAVLPDDDRLRRIGIALRTIMVAVVLFNLTIMLTRMRDFAAESKDFEPVLEAAAPGKRALAVMFASGSSLAAYNGVAYLHWPVWYEVERNGGLVDFNFCSYDGHMVARCPAAADRRRLADNLEWLDWRADHLDIYDYFFVRGGDEEVAKFMQKSHCPIRVVARSGFWWLFSQQCPAN